MGRHRKTLRLLDAAREVLEAWHPMTVRQVFYQLVSRQDALPVEVLRGRLTTEVESRMDIVALREVRALETRERERLAVLLEVAP